jgi:DNA gyrase subunit A
MLPLEADERITSIMPLPEDEESWANLDVMFATTRGTVRRNKLSDFVQVNRNGKIAMKFEEGSGDEILSVQTCSEDDDVLMTTALGQCIRFAVTDIRVFAGRNSTGVRGMNIAEGDNVISMSILGHVDATAEERAGYLKHAAALRRADAENEEAPVSSSDDEENTVAVELSAERLNELAEREQFVLTVSEFGYGKRSSSYDFRVSGRGGKGIKATDTSKTKEIGRLVATFPVDSDDQIMLVSDNGQVIRVPVDGIRFASRSTKGVTIFKTRAGERVVSVERISEPADDEAEDGEGIEAVEGVVLPEGGSGGPIEGDTDLPDTALPGDDE